MPEKFDINNVPSIYSGCVYDIIKIIDDIVNGKTHNHANFVKIDFDDSRRNNSYSYNNFAQDLRAMPCSRVFFIIHKRVGVQQVLCKNIVFCGIADKRGFTPINLPKCQTKFRGANMKKYILLPLTILEEECIYSIEKFSVLCLVFRGNCDAQELEDNLIVKISYEYSIGIKRNCKIRGFCYDEIVR